ncbi:hypothetical protein CDL12_15607 [Handroanthus impetiginosus]|uniref:Uncharacterized protein n=1 Tax=Handroanthus impetiginosus TaxID=429701 RepID=A0A2G9H2N4_9LAMI|nr:hypothetical protein CDL12_15607 [Handroanthus impetiginosus]
MFHQQFHFISNVKTDDYHRASYMHFLPLHLESDTISCFTTSLIGGLFPASFLVHLKATKTASFTCSFMLESMNSSMRVRSTIASTSLVSYQTDLTHATISILPPNDGSKTFFRDFFEDVGPPLSMQLGSKTLDGLYQVFNSCVNMLIRALPGSMEEEANLEGSGNKIVRMAETEAQQVALLANASLLAEELLPRAAMKLSPLNQANYKDDYRRRPMDRQNRNPEKREWRRRLVNSVDRLKDSFWRDSYLTADMYINMDGNMDEIEWSPSPIFQIHRDSIAYNYDVNIMSKQLSLSLIFLLSILCRILGMAGIEADLFVGRERFATLLLMRLTETVILWLSEDQTFWDDIEEGPRPLGPLGLQQFYLDMKFVMCFASQGRYSSRNLHRVVNDIISKALAAFAATGMDPYSVLPEDDWFNEICQDAMERLSGKPKIANGERDLNSPTTSVSAQSISSIRSHGSS